jgi:DNA-binding Lrp family transcriptional regulator
LSEEERNRLMRAMQAGVPFDERPFACIARDQGLEEGAVLTQLAQWSESGVLREISAVLEGAVLGYDGALVAGTVPDADLERVVEVVNAHPTVTHNYLRNHALNLWFTIAVPPQMSLEATLGLLADEAGAAAFHPLRRTHTFKIGVNFDPEKLENRTAATASRAAEPVRAGERDAALFRALQTPLPFVERPFAELAQTAGVPEAELLAFARGHLGGAIRRYVATLRHRKLGVRANGMVVWTVPGECIEEVGSRLAAAPEVSHCYARNPIEGFPYNLYSMAHGPDPETCRTVAARLSSETGIEDYAVLFSEREFKKARLRYFLPELDAWWEARAGVRAASDAGGVSP